MSSSSSLSEDCEKIKNVRSVMIKTDNRHDESDENYFYSRKLGDLVFNASFECGNLGHVERIDEHEYDIMVRPDVANPRHHLWFNFTVANQRPSQSIIFTVVNLSDTVRLFHTGFTPVVRNTSNPDWRRLNQDQVFYYKSKNHGSRYVLSISFKFESHNDQHQFALSYPYGHSCLSSYINRCSVEVKRKQKLNFRSRNSGTHSIEKTQSRLTPDNLGEHKKCIRDGLHSKHRSPPRSQSSIGCSKIDGHDVVDIKNSYDKIEFIDEVIAISVTSRPIHKITIGAKELSLSKDHIETQTHVVISCRDSGNLDGAASYICQAIMDYLLTDRLVARTARKLMKFHIFPMLDPDSVCAGNTRTIILGPSQRSITQRNIHCYRPCLGGFFALQNTLQELSDRGASTYVILIHLRCNFELIGSRLLGTNYSDILRMERHISLPRVMTHFAEDFFLENCDFSGHNICPPICWLEPKLSGRDNIDSYCLEVSPHASFKRSLAVCSYQPYNQLRYLSLGKSLVYALTAIACRNKSYRDRSTLETAQVLSSFHRDSGDIDDLLLDPKS